VHSVEALLDAGADVLVIDDLRHASYRPLPAAATLERVDIAEPEARTAIQAWYPAAILHLAAQGGVNRSWREPAADAHINVLGTVSVLAAAMASGCRRVVVASSGGALYGASRRLPTPEDEPAQPRSPYGTAKLSIEYYLGHFTRAGAIDALALRYGNVYGSGQDGTGEAGVVAISSHRLLDGKAPVIRGDGAQTRDFTYVGDIVAANVLGLTSKVTGAINIGTGRETSIGDLVGRLCTLAGYRGEPEREALPTGEVTRSALDNTLAAERLGWRPSVSLDEGLARTLASFRDQLR
jgi:UDP-glucose 4-epimerase